MKHLPIVALIGPPNSGKSTLLNRLSGKRVAVTSDVSGTTRDRQYAKTTWNGVDFLLVDTAGISPKPQGELEINMQTQVDIAEAEADIVLLVLNGKEPVAAFDQNLLKKFKRSKKKVLLLVNKCDKPRELASKTVEFSKLGIKDVFAVSALNGGGTGDLLDEVVKKLNAEASTEEEEEPGTIHVAIIGKPNVGKSSLFNAILGEERTIVSTVAGTTRTAIDTTKEFFGRKFVFIDTAGLKRRAVNQSEPEIFSGFQTMRSITRADVCLLVVEAHEKVAQQDLRLANEIMKLEKGVILVANKSDLLGEKTKEDKLQAYLSHHFPMLWMSPVHIVSAKDKEGIEAILKDIPPIYEVRNKTIPQEDIDTFLKKYIKKTPPRKLWDQRDPKIYGLTQTGINPPQFSMEVNHPAAIPKEFRNGIERAIIKDMEFWGTPIHLFMSKKK